MKQVLYTPQGIWKFYHDSQKGICYYGPGNTTPNLLYEKGSSDFDTACDEKGNLFLICQDDKNNIHLFCHDRMKWTGQCVMESKSVVPYDKDFRLFCTNEWVHAFYTIRHDGKFLLAHHFLNENPKPEIIETREYPLCYTAIEDSKQNIHLFYEKNGLQQKTFYWQNKSWSDALMLTEISGDLIALQGVFDEDDRLHLVYCKRNKQEYAVCYINQKETTTIASGLKNNPTPIILKEDAYHILFRNAGRLLQCSTLHPENRFPAPQFFYPGSFSAHSLFRVKSSTPLARQRIFANTLYGLESRPDKFEPTVIGDKIKKLDFTLPEKITEKPDDIELYKQEVSDFTPQTSQNNSIDVFQKLAELESRISTLENQTKQKEGL